MAAKRRNLFLYLTLVCFLGLIAIFIVDGYMGIYDTLSVTAGEYERKIESDYWLQQDQFGSTMVNWGDKAFFHYQVDNRQFSSYAADIEVSVWRSQEKLRDLPSQQISINAFDKGEIEWAIDTAEFLPGEIPPEQAYQYQYTIIIKMGELERRIIINVNPVLYPPKPLPARP